MLMFISSINAQLEVQGAFHASTADYLRLGEHGRFDARQPSNSLLTVAPVSAFGFLTDTPTPITLQESTLSVSEGQTLSLIGGDLRLNSTEPIYDDEGGRTFSSGLSAQFGRINLASVASRGEVMPTDSGFNRTVHKGGPIRVNNAEISTSGEGGGEIFIRAGRFELINSQINGRTLGDQNGGIINIEVDELVLRAGTAISTNSLGVGQGGAITLFVNDSLTLSEVNQTGRVSTINSHSISTETNAGDGGSIDITAGKITLMGGAQIGSATFGPGKGGSISIKASETLTASGIAEVGYSSGFATDSLSMEPNAGDAGNIDIETRQLLVSDGAQIGSATFGAGKGGTIIIKVTDTLTLTGVYNGFNSGIFVNAQNEADHAGDAGHINIDAGQINLTEGGVIASATFGVGKGGAIVIKATEGMTLSGFAETGENSGLFAVSVSEQANAGEAGRIDIKANKIAVIDGAAISNATFGPGEGNDITLRVTEELSVSGQLVNEFGYGITSQSESTASNAGNAGNISVQANTIHLSNEGQISTQANNATGGNINLTMPNLLLRECEIITRVQGGSGDGGNITLKNLDTLTLDNSLLLANAKRGHGGLIDIHADQIQVFGDSQIDVSSELGLNGSVFLNDSELTVTPHLTFDYFDASALLPTRCAERSGANLSRFVVTGPNLFPDSPLDLSVHLPTQLLTKPSNCLRAIKKQ